MRWPIRNQIFLPFAVLLVLSVVLVTVVSAWQTAENSREQKILHLQAIASAIGDGNFPLNQSVVDRLAKMIAGDVVVTDAAQKVTAATIANAQQFSDRLQQSDAQATPDGVSIEWQGQRYFVTRIDRLRVPPPRTLIVMIPEDDILTLQRNSVRPILLTAIPTLLVAIVLSLVVSRRLGIRIDNLRSLFRDLSQGEFRQIAAMGRNDELRDLLVSANDLSSQLDRMQAELIRSERLELLGQLSGGLAHQLRNSITGAGIAIQLHEKSCTTGDELLNTALAQLRLTEEQVAAVLSLRPDDTRERKNETIRLDQMLQEIRTLLVPQCEHWNTKLSLETKGRLEVDVSSPQALKGAILNLTINALQAAGTDGTVTMLAERSYGSVVVDIRDDGPGFKTTTEDPLEAFSTTKPDGIGLGLTIAKFAIEQESGTLSIRRFDNQTSVSLAIPIRKEASERPS